MEAPALINPEGAAVFTRLDEVFRNGPFYLPRQSRHNDTDLPSRGEEFVE
jgi:hypothetical protein